jgi:hypothetical protein
VAIPLLLKGMGSIVGVLKPIARLVPDSWPAETLLSLLAIPLICFVWTSV